MTARITTNSPQLAGFVLGLYACVGGLASLSGWVFDRPDLAAWFGRGLAIQPNAALCSAMAGAAACALALQWRRVAAGFATATLLVAAATLFEWLAGVSLGLDAPLTFGRAWGRGSVAAIGRMGVPGSTSFTLLGLALVLACGRSKAPRRYAPRIAIATAAIGVLSITGHLYGAGALFALPRVTAIAMQTATFIVALSVAIVALHPGHVPMRWLVSPTGLGAIARRSVPTVLLAPVALGWIAMEGERRGLYDTPFGTALLVLLLTALLGIVFWRGLAALARHEQALTAAEERMQLAMTAGATAVWDFDLTTGREPRSGSYYTLLGYDSEALRRGERDAGQWRSLVVPEDLDAVTHEWRRARAERNLCRMEFRARRADGSIMWLRAAGRFFYDEAGQPVRFAGAYVDVTSEKQAIESLRDADRRKDEFLAMLAHELRNPLAPLRNAVAVLKARAPSESELQWARDIVDRQVRQMSRLIEDLLDTSRIRSGKIELQRARVDLAEILQGAVESSRPLLDQHGHRLELELPDAPVTLDGDLVRLSQVFCNLLNNAARYTPRGGLVRVRAVPHDGSVDVSVSDNGIGIPPDMLPLVFDMFMQVDRSVERTRGGLGLGLTLVKQLVELHGGQVEARSAGVGQGCEFVVRLPLAAPAVEAARGRSPPSTSRALPSTSRRRVLVIDDNEDAATSLCHLLSLAGHRTRMAYDGVEGLRLAQEFRPDIVLLDLGLPKLNGFEVAAALRREPWGREPLLVALTGWGQDKDRERSHAAGFDEHLVKPVSLESLFEVLERRRRDPTDVAPAVGA